MKEEFELWVPSLKTVAKEDEFHSTSYCCYSYETAAVAVSRHYSSSVVRRVSQIATLEEQVEDDLGIRWVLNETAVFVY